MPRDFGRWFADQKPLPADVTFDKDVGRYMVVCRCCKERVEMLIPLEDHQEGNYWCGRGPGCCP